MFVLGLVLIPVFDTIRVFASRIWKGRSPFAADKTHIHHLLTNQGFSHVFAIRVIYFVHAVVLIEAYLLQSMRPEWTLVLAFTFMIAVTTGLKKIRAILPIAIGADNSLFEKKADQL